MARENLRNVFFIKSTGCTPEYCSFFYLSLTTVHLHFHVLILSHHAINLLYKGLIDEETGVRW